MTRDFSRQSREGDEFQIIPAFQSELVSPRNISVWLPTAVKGKQSQDYRVIYAHDGQNLFSPQTAFAGVDWGLHKALRRLPTAEDQPKTLVVGIWNTPARYREYDPQRVFSDYLSRAEKSAYARKYGQPLANLYMQFIVQELKPFIDSHFPTLSSRADTFLLGSSMGGIVSAYALCEYPEIFGGAACLSTHWPAGNGKMIDYLADNLPDPQTHRLYFDYGTETVDAQYEPFQLQVDEVMRRRGYLEGESWMTRKFSGADHSETAWRSRVEIPLGFLLS